jgi:hypothetical protein
MLSEIPTFPYVLSEEIDDFFRDANKESADGDGRWNTDPDLFRRFKRKTSG